jgi:hypothetical protein
MDPYQLRLVQQLRDAEPDGLDAAVAALRATRITDPHAQYRLAQLVRGPSDARSRMLGAKSRSSS